MNSALSFSLTFGELLTLHSAVNTIHCVYGNDPVREKLLFTLEEAVVRASNTHVVQIEVET